MENFFWNLQNLETHSILTGKQRSIAQKTHFFFQKYFDLTCFWFFFNIFFSDVYFFHICTTFREIFLNAKWYFVFKKWKSVPECDKCDQILTKNDTKWSQKLKMRLQIAPIVLKMDFLSKVSLSNEFTGVLEQYFDNLKLILLKNH